MVKNYEIINLFINKRCNHDLIIPNYNNDYDIIIPNIF